MKKGWLWISGLVLLIYGIGVNGPFVFDDAFNITENSRLIAAAQSLGGMFSAATSGSAGPLARPLPMITFMVNIWLDGLNPAGFKLFNIAIHGLNAVLVLFLAYRILQLLNGKDQAGLSEKSLKLGAWASALLFAVHPINFTSVLFVVQRMTSMACLFMLLALLCQHTQAFSRSSKRRWWAFTGFWGFLGCAILSKENAVVLVPLALWMQYALYDASSKRLFSSNKLHLILLWIAMVFGVIAVVWVWDSLVAGYSERPFSMAERLLTQGRVMMFYLKEIFIPGLSGLALYHDDYVASTDWLKPMSTLFSAIFLAAMVVVTLLVRRRTIAPLFMVIWFFVGHTVESSIISLELVFEHRNYFPAIGLFIGVGYGLAKLSHSRLRSEKIARVGLVAMVSMLGLVTSLRAYSWRDHASMAISEVARSPNSSRAMEEMAKFYVARITGPQDADVAGSPYAMALKFFRKSYLTREDTIIGLSNSILLSNRLGKEAEVEWVELLRARLANQKFHPYEFRSFVELLICQAEGECRLSSESVSGLISAALSNPFLSPSREAIIANNAVGVALRFGLPEVVRYYAEMAYEAAPDIPEFAVSLVILYKVQNQHENLERLLPSVKAMRLSDDERKRLADAGVVLTRQP